MWIGSKGPPFCVGSASRETLPKERQMLWGRWELPGVSAAAKPAEINLRVWWTLFRCGFMSRNRF